MTTNHRDLRKKVMAARSRGKADVKPVLFPMPNLRGPEGNAYWLLGQAKRLMKEAGTSDAVQTQFSSEATSGDYKHLLRTIGEWFTVVVAEVQYVPYTGDMADLIVPDDEGDIPSMNDEMPKQEDDQYAEAQALADLADQIAQAIGGVVITNNIPKEDDDDA